MIAVTTTATVTAITVLTVSATATRTTQPQTAATVATAAARLATRPTTRHARPRATLPAPARVPEPRAVVTDDASTATADADDIGIQIHPLVVRAPTG